ncbi:MAG: alpha-L-fucosidase [Bacteroides sp. SM23_62_1]|nr:MAG: alpha-L-fucosidase [Bacteroides sp. SM23_62_1]
MDIASTLYNRSFNPSELLWYTAPAGKWEEALPVGNGRLGAMVFGNTDEERIQLNEDTYWTGGPYSTVVGGGNRMLPEIQRLIFAGDVIRAHKMFGRYLMGYPVEQQKYQSLANLMIQLKHSGEVTGYKRWLDLGTGITGVEYRADGITFRREVFSSSPDQVIAVRLTADRPGSISFTASLRGIRNSQMSNYATDYFRMDGNGQDQLILTGKSADYLGIEGRLRYEARLKAVPEGGKMCVDDTDLIIENADAVTLYIVAATNFINYKDISADEQRRTEDYITGISSGSYRDILVSAISEYKKLFDRVSLRLPVTENSYLPTDIRMKKVQESSDPSLAALCYQFGRYLMISSSRPGTQPANLQGIWNQDMNPVWDSKYTTNINTEMNYWPVETGNLSECAEPLIRMVRELTDQGSEVASGHYGCRGWVFHQNTDIWRVAAPMDGPAWGTFTVGGAWLCTHLWEHFLFTRDLNYLKEIYPVIKGSVEFFMDFLIPDTAGQWLVTNPSTSPENPPKGPGYHYFFDEVTGMYYFTTICYGSSIDMQILMDLFNYYCQASEILKTDNEFSQKVSDAAKKLVPPQIGKDGSLQEWTLDLEQLEEEHRHFSHMYGLYPGNVISYKRTPELIDACRKVLEQRGDGGTGFSRAWKMALWARLCDGNRAYTVFRGYIRDQAYPQLFAKCYTPLQVDGSFGVTAAITEMLIQSHEGVIDLLPALPAEWNEGSFNGVCARGAFEVSMEWKNGQITKLSVLSKAGEICTINPEIKVKVTSDGRKTPATVLADGSVRFETVRGERYDLEVLK